MKLPFSFQFLNNFQCLVLIIKGYCSGLKVGSVSWMLLLCLNENWGNCIKKEQISDKAEGVNAWYIMHFAALNNIVMYFFLV